jgi:hypothetical protein
MCGTPFSRPWPNSLLPILVNSRWGSLLDGRWSPVRGKESEREFVGVTLSGEPELEASGSGAASSYPRLFPLERCPQWQATDDAGDIPISQSEPADALLNIHLVGNARSGQAIWQGFCGIRF